MQQLHLTVMLAGRLELGDEHPHAGAVDLRDAAEFQQNLVAALVEQLVDLPPEHQIPVVQRQLPYQFKDRHVTDAPFVDLQL